MVGPFRYLNYQKKYRKFYVTLHLKSSLNFQKIQLYIPISSTTNLLYCFIVISISIAHIQLLTPMLLSFSFCFNKRTRFALFFSICLHISIILSAPRYQIHTSLHHRIIASFTSFDVSTPQAAAAPLKVTDVFLIYI